MASEEIRAEIDKDGVSAERGVLHSAAPENKLVFPGPVTDLDPEKPQQYGVLRHKHFRTMWFAGFFSYMGGWFEFVGMQWIVAEKTGSTTWLSTFGVAQLAPTLIFGLFGGIVADRVNRKRLLLVTQFAMMLIAIAFSIVVSIDLSTPALLGWLLALATLQGITIVFNVPAQQVLTPRLVPREELVAAITLQGISFNITRAIGPAVGAMVMAATSATWLFAINAVGFVIVFIAASTTPDAPAPAREGSAWDVKDAWKDTKEALSFVWHGKGPRAAFLAMVVFSILATPIMRLLPLFVLHVYHLQENTFGNLLGVMGIGAAIGGIALKYVPKWYPKHHLIPLAVFAGGTLILLFSLMTNVWFAGAIMVFIGVCWMWAFNTSSAAMHMLVHDNMRGRVLSVCNVAALGLMPVGPFLAAGIGESASAVIHVSWPNMWREGLDAQIGVGALACVLMCAGLVMLIWRTPEVDGIKPGEPGYDRVPGFWRGVFAHAHRPRSS